MESLIELFKKYNFNYNVYYNKNGSISQLTIISDDIDMMLSKEFLIDVKNIIKDIDPEITSMITIDNTIIFSHDYIYVDLLPKELVIEILIYINIWYDLSNFLESSFYIESTYNTNIKLLIHRKIPELEIFKDTKGYDYNKLYYELLDLKDIVVKILNKEKLNENEYFEFNLYADELNKVLIRS